jgi:hypothetical protein
VRHPIACVSPRRHVHLITHQHRYEVRDSGVLVFCAWRLSGWRWMRGYFLPALDGAGFHRIPVARACWRHGWQTLWYESLMGSLIDAPGPGEAMAALREVTAALREASS